MTTAKYGKDIEGAKRFKLRYFPQAWESFIESETGKERRKTMQAEASAGFRMPNARNDTQPESCYRIILFTFAPCRSVSA